MFDLHLSIQGMAEWPTDGQWPSTPQGVNAAACRFGRMCREGLADGLVLGHGGLVFYRCAAIGIVSFWLVMTGLLVRLEFFPSTSDLLPVPVDHLFKLMFLHEQPSDLVLLQDEERIGDIHLQPHRFPPSAAGPRNVLAITGAMTLNLPGLETQHVTLRGAVEMDDRDTARHFELTANLHEPTPGNPGRRTPLLPQKGPPNLVIVFDGEPPRDQYHFLARRGEEVLAELSGTPAQLLDQPELSSIGLGPGALSGLLQQQAGSVQVTARRGVLRSKGEDIETYDVTLRGGGATQAIVQLSQLGQVLAVKTSAGYSLLDETLVP